MVNPETPEGQGNREDEYSCKRRHEGDPGGHARRIGDSQDEDCRVVIQKSGRDDVSKEATQGIWEDVHRMRDHVAATVREDVDYFDGFDGPESDRGAKDEQSAKKTYLAEDCQYGEQHLGSCPGNGIEIECRDEDGQANQDFPKAAQNEFRADDLQRDTQWAQQ